MQARRAVDTMRAMNEPVPTAVEPPGAPGDPRAAAGLAWVREALARPALAIRPLAGDASFRRYFRLEDAQGTVVLMDAPRDREDSRPFVDVAGRLQAAGVHAPRIHAADLDHGYLALEDLGDTLFRELIAPDSVDRWFPPLFELLAMLALAVDAEGLPRYDRNRLMEEIELFPEWYLGRHKGLTLSCSQLDAWEHLATLLLSSAEAQRTAFVHRDFHSCNLLLTPGEDIGVIDFQDAVRGPITYDFASLAWDRYVSWPRARLESWMEEFRIRVAPDIPPREWIRQVDWMGLQRNLKIVGIFARLHHRDGKAGYLALIPRFWGYVRDVLARYEEFRAFNELLEDLRCAP